MCTFLQIYSFDKGYCQKFGIPCRFWTKSHTYFLTDKIMLLRPKLNLKITIVSFPNMKSTEASNFWTIVQLQFNLTIFCGYEEYLQRNSIGTLSKFLNQFLNQLERGAEKIETFSNVLG